MVSPEILLGGKTRFSVIEALAEAKQPVTAYQIAMTKGLDPAATYRCLTEFSRFGVVEFETKDRSKTFYKLSKGAGTAAATFLRSLLAVKIESDDLEEWLSPKMQAKRMAKMVQLDKKKLANSSFLRTTKAVDVNQLMSKRASGELAALVESSRIAFNQLFIQGKGAFTLRK